MTSSHRIEGACWVEFDSEMFEPSGAMLDISLSENELYVALELHC